MKILIADDHRLVAEAVKGKLSELDGEVDIRIALTLADLEAMPLDDFDLAVIDLGMPEAQGIEHVRAVRQRCPGLPVIVLSGTPDTALMRESLDIGALGFIPKAYSSEVMISAVRLVLAGGVYVPPALLSAAPAASPPAHRAPLSLEHVRQMLTARQIEVLELLSEGKPNKLIGRSLGISEGTVKIHLAAIFRALNVRNRTEAVVAAQSLLTHQPKGEEGPESGLQGLRAFPMPPQSR